MARAARRIAVATGIAVASCLIPLCAAITSATPALSPQRMGFFEQQARLQQAGASQPEHAPCVDSR